MHDLNILIRHLLVDTFLEFKICERFILGINIMKQFIFINSRPFTKAKAKCKQRPKPVCCLKNFNFLIFCLDRDTLSTVFSTVFLSIFQAFPGSHCFSYKASYKSFNILIRLVDCKIYIF